MTGLDPGGSTGDFLSLQLPIAIDALTIREMEMITSFLFKRKPPFLLSVFENPTDLAVDLPVPTRPATNPYSKDGRFEAIGSDCGCHRKKSHEIGSSDPAFLEMQ